MKTDARSTPFVFLAGVLVGLVVCYGILSLKDAREESLAEVSLYPGKDFPLLWCEQCVEGWTPQDTAKALKVQPVWMDAKLYIMKDNFQVWCDNEGRQYDSRWLSSRTFEDLQRSTASEVVH